MQRVANSALPGSKRPRSSTQADNREQGARYLADVLETLPGKPTLEACLRKSLRHVFIPRS